MDMMNRIKQLKEEKNAVILAHYYVDADVQAAADFIGDSFYLAKKAAETDADKIVFAGVEFMGESAKILNPTKHVYMPDAHADCPMAHMVTIEKIKEMREKYDDLAVVCYINSTAEIKTYSDVCVTSSNAVKIVNKLPNKNIFFIPDQNLGSYVATQVEGKNIILNNDIDPRIGEDKSELQAIEELEEVNIDPQNPSRMVKLGKNLCSKRKAELIEFLQENLDVFAWSHEDMVGISPSVIMHTLHLDKSVPEKSQK